VNQNPNPGDKRSIAIGTIARITRPVLPDILPILGLCAIISFLMYLSVMSRNIRYTGATTKISTINSKVYQGIRNKLMTIGIKLAQQRYISVFFSVIIPSLKNVVLILR
jgi:hypothetical protein